METKLPIPAYLGISWWWLLVASVVEVALRYVFKVSDSIPSPVSGWIFLQAFWLKRAMPKSKAIYVYSFALAGELLAVISSSGKPGWMLSILGVLAGLLSLGWIVGIFVFRSEMQTWFSSLDGRYLSLSAVMTFFFSGLYFQYWFHELYLEQQADLEASKTKLETTPAAE